MSENPVAREMMSDGVTPISSSLPAAVFSAGIRILYGPFPNALAAEHFCVNSRTIRRWRSSQAPIPGPVAKELEIRLRDHAMRVDRVLEHFNDA